MAEKAGAEADLLGLASQPRMASRALCQNDAPRPVAPQRGWRR
jgi:hypothetical protein